MGIVKHSGAWPVCLGRADAWAGHEITPRELARMAAVEDAADEAQAEARGAAERVKAHAEAIMRDVGKLAALGVTGTAVDDFDRLSALDLAALDPVEVGRLAHKAEIESGGLL